jgi:hypothetical protein
MGYRGKLASRSRRATCGPPACPWPTSPRGSASPRAACRRGFATSPSSLDHWSSAVGDARRTRCSGGRRSTASLPRAGTGSAGCRSASSWSRGSRCTRARVARGMEASPSRTATPGWSPSSARAPALLPDRRVPPAGSWLPPPGTRSGRRDGLLVRGDGSPRVTVSEAISCGGRPVHSSRQACARLRRRQIQLQHDPPEHHGSCCRASARRRHSGVAQSAEQRPVKSLVASSSLAPGAAKVDDIRGRTPSILRISQDPHFSRSPLPAPGARTVPDPDRFGAAPARRSPPWSAW